MGSAVREHRGAVAGQVDGAEVAEGERRAQCSAREQDLPGVPAEGLAERHAAAAVPGERGAEHRRLLDPQPDVEPDAHEHHAEQERDPPPPRQERLPAHGQPGGEERGAGQRERDAVAELGVHPEAPRGCRDARSRRRAAPRRPTRRRPRAPGGPAARPGRRGPRRRSRPCPAAGRPRRWPTPSAAGCRSACACGRAGRRGGRRSTAPTGRASGALRRRWPARPRCPPRRRGRGRRPCRTPARRRCRTRGSRRTRSWFRRGRRRRSGATRVVRCRSAWSGGVSLSCGASSGGARSAIVPPVGGPGNAPGQHTTAARIGRRLAVGNGGQAVRRSGEGARVLVQVLPHRAGLAAEARPRCRGPPPARPGAGRRRAGPRSPRTTAGRPRR